MKRKMFTVLLALVMALSITVMAEAGGGHFKKYVNDDSSDKNRVEAGIGADVSLWKAENFDVDQETRFDLNSGDGTWEKGNLATYTVVKPKTEKGLFQIIGDKAKSLINKDEAVE